MGLEQNRYPVQNLPIGSIGGLYGSISSGKSQLAKLFAEEAVQKGFNTLLWSATYLNSLRELSSEIGEHTPELVVIDDFNRLHNGTLKKARKTFLILEAIAKSKNCAILFTDTIILSGLAYEDWLMSNSKLFCQDENYLEWCAMFMNWQTILNPAEDLKSMKLSWVKSIDKTRPSDLRLVWSETGMLARSPLGLI